MDECTLYALQSSLYALNAVCHAAIKLNVVSNMTRELHSVHVTSDNSASLIHSQDRLQRICTVDPRYNYLTRAGLCYNLSVFYIRCFHVSL